MGPHEPGITDCKKAQGQESQRNVERRDRLLHQRDQGEEEAHQPGMLVESPQLEGESARCDALIWHLSASSVGGVPGSSLPFVCALHVFASFRVMSNGYLSFRISHAFYHAFNLSRLRMKHLPLQ